MAHLPLIFYKTGLLAEFCLVITLIKGIKLQLSISHLALLIKIP